MSRCLTGGGGSSWWRRTTARASEVLRSLCYILEEILNGRDVTGDEVPIYSSRTSSKKVPTLYQ